MKIKMKTSELIDLFSDIQDFFKKDIALSKQIIWDLDDNYETIKKIVDRFEKHRAELIQPLNEKQAFYKGEDGEIKVKDEFYGDFLKANDEIAEYLQTDNEIEIKTISRKSIPDTLSFKDWKALKFMCEND